jgi:hypothetical protein
MFGRWVQVRVIPLASWPHDVGDLGMWDPQNNTIDIRGDQAQVGLETTYLHELTHALLDGLSNKLTEDEAFVDQFAHLLHQALTSAKYPRKKRVRQPTEKL